MEPVEAQIRRATVDDAATVAGLLHDFDVEFDSPTPPVEVLERRFATLLAEPQAFVLLAERQVTEAVGFALVTLRPTVYGDGPLAVLDELYVVPPLRDRSIGTRLLQRALREVRERCAVEMHLNVDEVDHDTRRFYERHGFVNVEPGTDYRMLCYVQAL